LQRGFVKLQHLKFPQILALPYLCEANIM
jgi:hypothetical protein